jgi:hypothetical protein
MSNTLQFISHVNANGLLQVQLPKHLADQEVEIILTVRPFAENPRRPLGQYAGKMQMSEDFCAPLPEEFWLGERD